MGILWGWLYPIARFWTLVVDQYIYLNNKNQLLSLIKQWLKLDIIAVDTEFERSRTYFPVLSLVQIYDGKQAYLIDLLGEDAPIAELKQIITNKHLIKVIHSAEEDIAALYHRLNAAPENVIDSQIAADMAGLGSDLAYIKLVSQLESTELSKSETRTDWLQRPLTQAQLSYAAEDVIYLFPLYHKLCTMLKAQGRYPWLLEESEHRRQKIIAHYHEDGSNYFYRIAGASKLNGTQQQILMRLCLWREKEARARNVPRQHLFRDKLLLSIAEQQTTHPQLSPRLNNVYVQERLKKYQPQLNTCLLEGEDLNQNIPLMFKPVLNRTQAKGLKQLIAYRNQKAEQLGIGSNLLLSKRKLTEVIRVHYGLSTKDYGELITGWRAEILLPGLIEQLDLLEIV